MGPKFLKGTVFWNHLYSSMIGLYLGYNSMRNISPCLLSLKVRTFLSLVNEFLDPLLSLAQLLPQMEFLKSFNAINQRNTPVFNVLLQFQFSFTAFFGFLSRMWRRRYASSLFSSIVSTKIPCKMGQKNLKKLLQVEETSGRLVKAENFQ